MLMVVVGFIQGLALGTLAACLMFTMYYSAFTSPVRHVIGGGHVQANIYRPRRKHKQLLNNGHLIQIVQVRRVIRVRWLG